MQHPLDGLLPNDAPWRALPVAVVTEQCAIRNLSVTGLKKDLVQRLLAYRLANPNTPDVKRRHPWLTEPVYRSLYEVAALEAENAKLQVVRVVDKPGRKGGNLRRDFQLSDDRKRNTWNNSWERQKPITVSIDIAIKCDCPMDGSCLHTIYVLRFVLNCPEPYRWQRALLPSELRTIYQHSHASRAFGPKNSETHNDFCIFCFRDIDKSSKGLDHCEKCTRGMHPICRLNAGRVRKPVRKGTCWICYEDIEWDIEKFCWNDRVLPAAPSTAPAVPAQIGSAVDATRELIHRKEPDDDDFESSSSSSDEDSEEEQPSKLRRHWASGLVPVSFQMPTPTQSTNRRFPSILSSPSSASSTSSALESTVNQLVPYPAGRLRRLDRKSKIKALELIKKGVAPSTSIQSNESIPLPGNPALIWQETQREREQQQEKERQKAALPNLSPALGHALPALNPGGGDMEPSEVATAPNAARIPAGDYTSPRASSSAAVPSASTAITATPQHNQAGATSISAHNPSVEGVISQTPQIGDTTISTTEPAAATGSQHTTSTTTANAASASAPVPPGHSASTPTHSPSGTHTNIDNAKAMELVRECSRLAKKSGQIRKKSERKAKRMEKKQLKKITKMEKKHRRELKKTKRKSKQEVKRLEKKIQSLEKEVLKALARPEVAEGAAA